MLKGYLEVSEEEKEWVWEGVGGEKKGKEEERVRMDELLRMVKEKE